MFFFFFKQKTAYEMRISDWSSDVCSSDLHGQAQVPAVPIGLGFAIDRNRTEAAALGGTEHARQRAFSLAQGEVKLVAHGANPRVVGQGRLRMAQRRGAGRAEIGRASWRERVCQDV